MTVSVEQVNDDPAGDHFSDDDYVPEPTHSRGTVGAGISDTAYSTNQSTVKARRRQDALTGAARVEHDARTADYKAMLYARKNMSDTAPYKAADEEVKKRLLEECMREAMEKRRQRGQDTMSKVSAYHAGVKGQSGNHSLSSSRVPIASFLEENGYVHARGSAASQLPDSGVGKNRKRKAEVATSHIQDHRGKKRSISLAGTSITKMPVGTPAQQSPHARIGGGPLEQVDGPAALSVEGSGYSPPPFNSTSAHESASRHAEKSNSKLFGGAAVAAAAAVKAELVDSPSFPIYKGPTLPRMDKYTNIPNHLGCVHHAVTTLSSDMANIHKQLRAVREHDVRTIRAEMTIDKTRVNDLTSQLEATNNRIFAVENNQVPPMQSQIRKLEDAVTELEKKVGQGGTREIAKMRAVMATLQTALEKEGGYLE